MHPRFPDARLRMYDGTGRVGIGPVVGIGQTAGVEIGVQPVRVQGAVRRVGVDGDAHRPDLPGRHVELPDPQHLVLPV